MHPWAIEILFVMEGSLLVGFVTTNNQLYLLHLWKGVMWLCSPKVCCMSSLIWTKGQANGIPGVQVNGQATAMELNNQTQEYKSMVKAQQP